MTKNGPLDATERTIRIALGVALLLLAWGFGWTTVEGVASVIVGVVALLTAFSGYCPVDRTLSRLEGGTS